MLWALDPYTCFYNFSSETRAAPDGKNVYGYRNPVYDELLEKAIRTAGRTAKTKIYRELEKMTLTELVTVPFFNLPRLLGFRKTVHDLRPHDSWFIYLHTPWNNVWKEKK